MLDSALPQGFFLQAPIFAALGDETRLSLIARLSRASGQSISQLAEGGAGAQRSKGTRDFVRVRRNTDRNDDAVSGSGVQSMG